MSELAKVYDRSRVPLYIQVASVMRRRIETGQWLPGQRISTLVELEREFEVARVTIRQAIDILREEGLLRSQQGRGTFVAEKPVVRHWFKLATSWDALIETIKNNVPKRIKVEHRPTPPILLDGEGKLADKYVFMRSVQYKDGEPYGLVNVHLADAVFRLSSQRFRQEPALSVLASMEEVVVNEAHQTVVIGSADPETSDLLRIALGSAVAECRCVVIDDAGVAVYVAGITYRSDAIKLHIDLFANSRQRLVAGHARAARVHNGAAAARRVRNCN